MFKELLLKFQLGTLVQVPQIVRF
ncbi:MAG: hypothetical protein ACD_34C00293G0002, partial [uncultured bacterium]